MKRAHVKHRNAIEIPKSKAGTMKLQIVVEMEQISQAMAVQTSPRLRVSLYPSLEATSSNI
jgi:hypothetical protein